MVLPIVWQHFFASLCTLVSNLEFFKTDLAAKCFQHCFMESLRLCFVLKTIRHMLLQHVYQHNNYL